MINTLCRCRVHHRAKPWHLVCPTCWAKVPPLLQDEVYAAYREKPGSPRHLASVRRVFEALGPGEKK